jgi:hypothetical protein
VLSLVAGEDRDALERHRDVPAGEVRTVPGVADLVDDRGAVESVAVLAGDWLVRQLDPAHASSRPVDQP